MTTKIDRIELYHKHCYGCDRNNDYEPLNQFIIRNRLPLDTLVIKRIETNPEWQEEAKEIGLDLPFLRITKTDGSVDNIYYPEWRKKMVKIIKTTGIKKSKTKNQSLIEEAKESQNE